MRTTLRIFSISIFALILDILIMPLSRGDFEANFDVNTQLWTNAKFNENLRTSELVMIVSQRPDGLWMTSLVLEQESIRRIICDSDPRLTPQQASWSLFVKTASASHSRLEAIRKQDKANIETNKPVAQPLSQFLPTNHPEKTTPQNQDINNNASSVSEAIMLTPDSDSESGLSENNNRMHPLIANPVVSKLPFNTKKKTKKDQVSHGQLQGGPAYLSYIYQSDSNSSSSEESTTDDKSNIPVSSKNKHTNKIISATLPRKFHRHGTHSLPRPPLPHPPQICRPPLFPPLPSLPGRQQCSTNNISGANVSGGIKPLSLSTHPSPPGPICPPVVPLVQTRQPSATRSALTKLSIHICSSFPCNVSSKTAMVHVLVQVIPSLHAIREAAVGYLRTHPPSTSSFFNSSGFLYAHVQKIRFPGKEEWDVTTLPASKGEAGLDDLSHFLENGSRHTNGNEIGKVGGGVIECEVHVYDNRHTAAQQQQNRSQKA